MGRINKTLCSVTGIAGICIVGAAALLAGGLAVLGGSYRSLPYKDSFASGKGGEWKAYDGEWSIIDGAVRNESDERGAKFMTGSASWRNYTLESDIQLLGTHGDGGVIVRSTNEERGVDSYNGYFVGLRAPDSSLIIGRANYDWIQLKATRIRPGLKAFHWYHLKVVTVGCSIAARFTDPQTGETNSVSVKEDPGHCANNGRIGLRSVATGGVWRNIRVVPATVDDLRSLVRGQKISEPSSPATLREILGSYQSNIKSAAKSSSTLGMTRLTQPIDNLRLASVMHKDVVSVRGQVILTQPVLFIQDSTGGASVLLAKAPPLKLGDEVEVDGEAEPHEFSSTIRNATVSLLWPEVPDPPVSVTPFLASTGAFDSRFVELQARLDSEFEQAPNRLILKLHENDQYFQGILQPYNVSLPLNKLKRGSVLGIRGICTSNARYTNNLIPFVILLRSINDVRVINGPPWWSARNLIVSAVGCVFLALIGYLFYIRAERWRLRAVIEERQRLAHELHDTLAQSFAGIGFQLSAIRKKIPETFSLLREQIDITSELVRQGHLEARLSLSTLRPNSCNPIELLSALEKTAQRMTSAGSITLETSTKGARRILPLKVTDVLFRVGQEAVANAVRHASATKITIQIEYQRNALQLTVEDNGVGFNTGESVTDGFGLIGIHKRVESVGGSIRISSLLGSGTRVIVQIPLLTSRRSSYLFEWFISSRSSPEGVWQKPK